jgi:hypothetical protein
MSAEKMSRWMRRLGTFYLLMVLVGTSGCATIAGRWSGGDLMPAMARDQFDLFRPSDNTDNFVSAELRLQSDGTYMADIIYGEKLVRSAGTWKLDGRKLTMTDNSGRSQVFVARKTDKTTLTITTGIKGTEVILTVKKQV